MIGAIVIVMNIFCVFPSWNDGHVIDGVDTTSNEHLLRFPSLVGRDRVESNSNEHLLRVPLLDGHMIEWVDSTSNEYLPLLAEYLPLLADSLRGIGTGRGEGEKRRLRASPTHILEPLQGSIGVVRIGAADRWRMPGGRQKQRHTGAGGGRQKQRHSIPAPTRGAKNSGMPSV